MSDRANVTIERLELQLDVAGAAPDNAFARELQRHFPMLCQWLDAKNETEKSAARDRNLGDRPAEVSS